MISIPSDKYRHNLIEAVLLDQLQKGRMIKDNAIDMLRKRHLVEGRKPNIYIAKLGYSTKDILNVDFVFETDNFICRTLFTEKNDIKIEVYSRSGVILCRREWNFPVCTADVWNMLESN